MKRIKIDRSKCISCLTCVTACVVSHESCDSRNRVVVDSEGKNSPIFCAMSKDKETGYVQYDGTRCASCYMCIMACPYGVLKADRLKQKYIMKCDMCTSHDAKTPQCVANCPMEAITLEEVK